MKLFNFNISNAFGKTLLWFFSITFLLVIIIQLSLWVGIKWLNSEQGSLWAQNNINIALKDSDYNIDFQGFKYTPLTAITVKELLISNQNEKLIEVDNAKLSVNITSLALKQLSFSLKAKKATLFQLPSPQEKTETEKSAKPFSFPDIYFNTINISDINIENLEISEDIAGQKINLSPRISGAFSVSRDLLKIKLNLYPDAQKITSLQNLPDKIIFNGQYNAQNLIFTLDDFAVKSSLYSAFAKGEVNLSDTGNIALSGLLKSDNLVDLNPELDGKVDSRFSLSGTKENLTFKSDGNINLEQLTNNDFTPITFHIHSNILNMTIDQLKANISLKSSYQNLPITLVTEISKNNDLILFNNIKGSAPDIDLTGALNINPQTTLIDGDFKANVSKLDNYKKLIGQEINGSGNIDLTLSHANGIQKINSKSNIKNISFNDIKTSHLTLISTTADIKKYKATELNLSVKDIKFNKISLNNADASVAKSETGYALKLKGNGLYNNPFSFNAATNLINLESADLAAKAENIIATIKLGNSPISITGSINVQNIDLKAKTQSLVLKDIPITLPQALNRLSISGTASAQGLMNNPVIKTDINVSPLSLTKNTPDINLTIKGAYNSGLATIDLNGRGTGIQQLQGNVKTPLKLSLNPFILNFSDKQPLDGKITLSLQTKDFADALLPAQYNLSGSLISNINLSGNIKNPTFAGNASLESGTFTDNILGINLRNISLSTLLSNNQITLKNLSTSDDKDGKLSAKGFITLDNYALGNTDLKLSLTKFHLLQSDLADGLFNADIKLNGAANRYNLTGTIKSDYIDVSIPEKFNQSIPELNIVEKNKENPTTSILNKINLGLEYIADNRIFVRGWGLDAEFGGKISIKGSLDNPQFDGRLQSSRGRFEEFGKRFKLTKANLNFLGSIPPSPNLDITAETKADDIVAKINLTGSITQPEISFSSTPSLPDDEVLSRILFGRGLATISPFQAVQLAQTLHKFSGKGGSGFDPLAKIRETTGFDDLRVETDEDGQANVGVGKYLTDKVYLEFEKGTGEDSGAANLQVEVTPNITIESEFGQDTQGGAGVFWEWDY